MFHPPHLRRLHLGLEKKLIQNPGLGRLQCDLHYDGNQKNVGFEKLIPVRETSYVVSMLVVRWCVIMGGVTD